MTDDRIVQLLLLLGALMLALKALSMRRITLRGVAQTLVVWAIVGLVMFLVVNHRHELGGLFARMSERFGYEQQVVEGDTVRIRMSPDGHFWARVRINGVERRMLIDSGATITAVSRDTAEAAGIEPALAPPVLIETANGTVQARSARAGAIEIGPLGTRDLHVVVSDSFGDLDVIGMNFLSRLKSWRVEDRTLILEPRKPGSGAGGTRSAGDGPVAGRRSEAERARLLIPRDRE